jgi:putative oxidoreductase
MKQRISLPSLFTGHNALLLGLTMLLLRLTVGSILFIVGAGKVLGWFGGMGLSQTIQIFTSKVGIAAWLAYLSCFTEFIGGFLLAIGLLTRIAAIPVTINMAVAFSFMLPKGFIAGKAAYPFSLMVIALVILLEGPMQYSLDALFFRTVGTERENLRETGSLPAAQPGEENT